MTPSTPEPEGGSASVRPSTAPIRLTGSWLIISRAVWLVLVMFSLGLCLAGLPVFYEQIQSACSNATTCSFVGALTTKGLQALAASGVSASGYAAFTTVFWATIAAIWGGIGFLIFWRRSDDWFALLAALFLVIFNPTYPGFSASALALVNPALSVPLGFVSFLGHLSLSLFFLLFPNGRVIPRWVSFIFPLVIIQAVSSVVPPTSLFSSNTWPQWLPGVLALTINGSTIVAQIYRYRHVSTALERQQTKWVVFGISTVVTGFLVFGLLFSVVFPAVTQADSPASLIQYAIPLLLLLIPVSVGMAILRSRLWDIDTIINKALVYGLLTGILGALYAGLIIGLESLAAVITRQASTNPLVLVISTLAIAALFHPVRKRIQNLIDQRFHRRKYDAEKILTAFSATLRNEVDLGRLREGLLTVVQETVQPAHASLWLCPPSERSSGESSRPLEPAAAWTNWQARADSAELR